jgi:hypothetical protein
MPCSCLACQWSSTLKLYLGAAWTQSMTLTMCEGSLLSSCAATAAVPGAAQQQLALMRQRSIALQQAVAQSRLGSAVAKSRFASASRRWGTKLQPLVSAKVADQNV